MVLPGWEVLSDRLLDERFKDDSIRLVRDIPVGTPAWKRIYHRARNAVEGRNSTLENWGLKRLPIYGDLGARLSPFKPMSGSI